MAVVTVEILNYEETATLLRELDGLIDGDRYFMSPRIDPESDPRQDQAGAGARAVASPAEAICATAGDSKAETGRRALTCPDERRGTIHNGKISLAH